MKRDTRGSRVGGFARSTLAALSEDRRLLVVALAFAIASIVTYRLIVSFGWAH